MVPSDPALPAKSVADSSLLDVLLVTADQGADENQTVFWAPELYQSVTDVSYNWICTDQPGFKEYSDTCDVAEVRRQANDWSIKSRKIEHCLIRLAPRHCKLQFSQAILITVIIMNFSKVAVMFWTYYFQKSLTLVTVGDAVASFLCSPDESTRFRCLMTAKDVNGGPLRWRPRGHSLDDAGRRLSRLAFVIHMQERWSRFAPFLPLRAEEREIDQPGTQPLPQSFSGNFKHRWFRAASVKRWISTIFLLLTALITVAVLLSLGVNNGSLSNPAQGFRLGFGKIDPRLLIYSGLPMQGASGLLSAVLLANLPQAICSFIYLTYNGLFTCMLSSEEWSRYFLRPKPLRVSTPHGSQRSKYYLQLPFAYSAPLLAASVLLHWLISESIFLARIDFYEKGIQRESMSASTPGYSPLPILLVLILGIFMLGILIGNGFRRFSSPMPVVGSCSVAISSACHRPKDDEDAAFLPVAWGDVNHEGAGEVGHCAFTSQQVYEPVKGRLYAGDFASVDALHEVRARKAWG